MLELTPFKIVATTVAIASAVTAFLLSQPDVVLSPGIKVVLGAAQVALTVLALKLNLDAE